MLGREDLQPVAVGIGDKVDAHGLVLETDAAPFLSLLYYSMQGIARQGENKANIVSNGVE